MRNPLNEKILTAKEIYENAVEEGIERAYCFEDGVLYHSLDVMPFDKRGRNGLVHATGREYWSEEDQHWIDEYEDEDEEYASQTNK